MASWKRVLIAAVVAVLALVAFLLTRNDRTASSGPSTATPSTSTPSRAPVARMTSTGSIAGTVRDSKQAPVAGARVCAQGSAHDLPYRLFRKPSCATTDPNGAYSIPNLIGASYSMSAHAPRRHPARAQKLLLATGEQKTGVDLVLADGGIEVNGTVHDVTGGPIAGAWVTAEDEWTNVPLAYAETNAAGEFTLWVRPGDLWVSAAADGYVSDSETAAEGQRVQIVLTPASSLSGTVVDARSGEPVGGISVYLDEASGSPSDISDEAGRFLIESLRPGRRFVTARGPHHFGASDGTVLIGLAQDVVGVVVRVGPAARVSATVMLAEKPPRPCDEPRLFLRRDDGESMSGNGDVTGAVYVDGVVPGRYDVTARCGWQDPSDAQTIEVATSAVAGLRFEVKALGALRGHVRTTTGEPVANASIRIDHYERGRSDATGAYEITNFTADSTLDVSAVSPAGTTPPTDDYQIAVPAGTVVERDLVLAAASRVRGRVVDANGKPGSRVQVLARRHYDEKVRFSSAFFADTRDDGTYELVAVPAGTYSIRVWGDDGVRQLEPKADKLTVVPPAAVTWNFVIAGRAEVISGTVTDAAGAPVADAYIVASPEEDGGNAMEASRRSEYWAKVVTDQDGRFRITDLIAGSYTVRALRRGGGEAIAEHVSTGSSVALQIKLTGSIEGTLTSRARFDTVQVTAEEQGTRLVRKERLFNSSRRFALRDLPAGTYVVAVHAGSRITSKRVELAAGQQLTGVDFDLDAGVMVTGRIVDIHTSQPVAGAKVFARSHELERIDMSQPQTTTDASGRFTFDSLAPGLCTISGHPPKGRDMRFDVIRILAGARVELGDIGMPKPIDYDKAGTLGITFKDYPTNTTTDAMRFEVAAVQPPAAPSVAVGDIVTSVNGIDITGSKHSAGWSLLLVEPGTALRLGLASGKTVTVVAAKRN